MTAKVEIMTSLNKLAYLSREELEKVLSSNDNSIDPCSKRFIAALYKLRETWAFGFDDFVDTLSSLDDDSVSLEDHLVILCKFIKKNCTDNAFRFVIQFCEAFTREDKQKMLDTFSSICEDSSEYWSTHFAFTEYK